MGGNNLRIYFEKPEKEKQTASSDETLSVAGTPVSVEELQKKAQDMLSKNQASSETPYAVAPKLRDERGIYAKIIEIQAVSEGQVKELHQELLQNGCVKISSVVLLRAAGGDGSAGACVAVGFCLPFRSSEVNGGSEGNCQPSGQVQRFWRKSRWSILPRKPCSGTGGCGV